MQLSEMNTCITTNKRVMTFFQFTKLIAILCLSCFEGYHGSVLYTFESSFHKFHGSPNVICLAKCHNNELMNKDQRGEDCYHKQMMKQENIVQMRMPMHNIKWCGLYDKNSDRLYAAIHS